MNVLVLYKASFSKMYTSSSIVQVLLRFSPEAAPGFWTIINATIFLYSIALLVIVAFRDEGDIAYDKLAQEWYLTYDVITCLVWLLETSMTMTRTWCNQSSDSTKRTSIWEKLHIVEWILAIYFVADSITRIIRKKRGEDHTVDMALDIGLNVVGYGYILFRQYRERCNKELNDGFQIIDDNGNNAVDIKGTHDRENYPASYQLSV
jgi:hypothetical protein